VGRAPGGRPARDPPAPHPRPAGPGLHPARPGLHPARDPARIPPATRPPCQALLNLSRKLRLASKSRTRASGAVQDSPPFVKVFSKKGRYPFSQMGALPPNPRDLSLLGQQAQLGATVKTAPNLSALGAALRSHPCVALSSAQAILSLSNPGILQLPFVGCPFPRRSGSYNVPVFSIAISTASQRSATPRVARP
jgi:hypothetical protein